MFGPASPHTMHNTRDTARNATPAPTTNWRHTPMTDSGVDPRAGGSWSPGASGVSPFFLRGRVDRGDPSANLLQFALELRGASLRHYRARRCLIASFAPAITSGSSIGGELSGLFELGLDLMMFLLPLVTRQAKRSRQNPLGAGEPPRDGLTSTLHRLIHHLCHLAPPCQEPPLKRNTSPSFSPIQKPMSTPVLARPSPTLRATHGKLVSSCISGQCAGEDGWPRQVRQVE